MKFTERERVLLLLLPAAVILGGYAWWFSVFYRPKLQTVQHDYAAAFQSQVRPSDLEAAASRKTKLQAALADLDKQKADLEARAAAVCGRAIVPAARIAAERQLAELMGRHRLQLLEAAPAAKGSETKLPKALTEAIGRLGPTAHDKTGQVRCLRLTGRFVDVLLAVEELSKTETSPVIPISLTMAEADMAAEARHWTLVVWM